MGIIIKERCLHTSLCILIIQIEVLVMVIVLILHWNIFASPILISCIACDFFINKKGVFMLLVELGRIALLERMNLLFVLSSSESLVMQMFVMLYKGIFSVS